MKEYITEPQRAIPVVYRYDVVVIGGGIAGVAAAVAAARNGAKTLLVEKGYALGGLATLGNVIMYLPLCDGIGRQVTFGLAEEMLHLAVREGSAGIPACWQPGGDVSQRKKWRYQADFNPASVILEYERFVLENNVRILYDTRACNVLKFLSGRIDAVVLENKSGRFAVECGNVIDATGDADICHLAGEETQTLNVNTAAGWSFAYGREGIELFQLSRPFDEDGMVIPEPGDIGYDGTDGESVTASLIATREMIRDHVASTRESRNDYVLIPLILPTYPGFRMTRRLVGKCDFVAEDRWVRDDNIGYICDWRNRGPIYSVPFGSLCAVNTPNLLAVGRCISAAGYSWDQSRVIPACAVTGQAAGTAAALRPGDATNVDVSKLQARLQNDGVKLDLKIADPKVLEKSPCCDTKKCCR
jgi:hypothetical protein